MTEFITARIKAKYTLTVSNLSANGIAFSNLVGYFTVKIYFFDDATQKIEDQLNILLGAYYD